MDGSTTRAAARAATSGNNARAPARRASFDVRVEMRDAQDLPAPGTTGTPPPAAPDAPPASATDEHRVPGRLARTGGLVDDWLLLAAGVLLVLGAVLRRKSDERSS